MQVEVRSSARLHLGFYTISSDEIAYGSIGVAINKPKVIIHAEEADEINIKNLTGIDVEEDVKDVIKRMNVQGAKITVLEAIPRHVGLGSTTQLKLATAYALSKIYGLRCNIRRLAFTLGRGTVSGIGIAVFEHGGFIIDSGRLVRNGMIHEPRSLDDIPAAIFRAPLPKNWRFIVAVPKGIHGLDEKEEKKPLEAPEFNEKLERELHDAMLIDMLPALARRDAKRFGEALTKIQRLVGRYFSKFQGGEFCCWETEKIVEYMLENGAYGAGQSSWGPTAYGLTEGKKRAEELLNRMLRFVEKSGIDAEIFEAQPRNRGFYCRAIRF